MKFYGYEDRTIGKLVEDKAKTFGDKVWLYYKNQEYTYNQINDNSNRLANALIKLGIKKGDHVASLIPNCPEHFYSWFGIVKAGAVDVQINNLMRGQSLLDQIVRSGAVMLVLHERFLKRYIAVQENISNIKQIIFIPEEPDNVKSIAKLGINTDVSILTEILESSPASSPKIAVQWDSPESITYSSGTTGPPKAIKVSHNYQFEYCLSINKHMYTTPRDIIGILYPMYNVTGRSETSLRSLLADCRAVLFDHFDVNTFWEDIKRYGITQCEFVGGIILGLLKVPPKKDDTENPLEIVFTAAAGTALELKQEFERRFDVMLIEVYGQTEIGVATLEPIYARKSGSQGIPCGHYEVKIMDEDGRALSPFERGEIVLRPLKPHVMMMEYYGVPEEKQLEKSRNGHVYTGDRGYLDNDGYLYFEGRIMECIRTKGYMTSVTQIEEIINSHPGIAECGAKGVPAAKGEEEDVMVCVKLMPGVTPGPVEVLRYCEEHMPYYMVPSYIEFVTELPKTATLKIDRGTLAGLTISGKTWDRRKAGYKLKRE